MGSLGMESLGMGSLGMGSLGILVVMVVMASGTEKEFYIDRKGGETGRYSVVTNHQQSLCHYGIAATIDINGALSVDCWRQNHAILTEQENNTKMYPYFFPGFGEPPGCGALPNVSSGEWVCPRGVSSSSVPVYKSCRLQCWNGSIQGNNISVRCTERLEWDQDINSTACSKEGFSVESPDMTTLIDIIVPKGCGVLPNVSSGEWVCPRGVSSASVPVYESCRLQCWDDSIQRNNISVRCTERLEWDQDINSTACSKEGFSVESPDMTTLIDIIVPKGCGVLPNVSSGEWVCPRGVSSASVPVYESCRLQCWDGSIQGNDISVRCTERLEWDQDIDSTACSKEGLPVESLDMSTLIATCIIVPIIVVFLVAIGFIRFKCWRKLIEIFSDPLVIDNHTTADALKNFEMETVSPRQNEVVGEMMETDRAEQNHFKRDENDRLGESACGSCISVQAQLASNGPDDVFQEKTTLTSWTENDSFTEENNSKSKCKSSAPYHFNSESESNSSSDANSPLPQLTISSYTIDNWIESLKFSPLKEVGPGPGSFCFQSYPQKPNDMLPADEPAKCICLTFAAALDGALEDSVGFVDDLSTLLDPDNPRNWQSLAQSYLNLSYNKIREIRHKTKDHFKEAILPFLSSHGYRITHMTHYFYELPSRRIDVIECIQRYHPVCPSCEEIYSCIKS